jgi:hypothetical protein
VYKYHKQVFPFSLPNKDTLYYTQGYGVI